MAETTDAEGLRELTFDFEQRLYHEAALLDARRFEDWLEMLSEELSYWAPARPFGVEPTESREVTGTHFWETKRDLRARIARTKSKAAWAFAPASRTRHMIGNVRILAVDEDTFTVESNFVVHCSRSDRTERTYVGRREDKWRGDAPNVAKLVERRIEFDHNVIENVLTFF